MFIIHHSQYICSYILKLGTVCDKRQLRSWDSSCMHANSFSDLRRGGGPKQASFFFSPAISDGVMKAVTSPHKTQHSEVPKMY